MKRSMRSAKFAIYLGLCLLLSGWLISTFGDLNLSKPAQAAQEPKGSWPSLERQLTVDKIIAGSALDQLIRANQDFSVLHPREASDTLGLPPWLRVHWRRMDPDWSYSPDDPTGNYPRALKNVYLWMITHQDLKPGSEEPPSPPKGRGLSEDKIAAIGANLRISGAQTTFRSESNISVNYGDPMKIIAAANSGSSSGTQAQFYSSDGGATWGQTTLPLTSSDLVHSDPAVDWTSDGRAWAATLGISVSSNTLFLQGRAYVSTNNGQTWTFDGTFSGGQTRVDKPMMWVDHGAASPFKDNIYVIYHNNAPAFMNRRTSAGWQTPIQVSSAETAGTGIGGDVKTNSAGDVFGLWPDTGSGRIFVVKSTNGGVSYSPPTQVAATFDTFDTSVASFSTRRALIYVTGGAYRTASKNLVYAAWTDLSGESDCTRSGNESGSNANSPCKTRIWFARSTNGGATWSPKVMINNQSGRNDQFNPWLVVDETSGNLGIIYYDTAGDPGRKKVDLWYQSSPNDGAGWNPPVKVTTAQTDETATGADSGNQFGDYNGLSGINGAFFPSWTDRRGGGREEIWTAKTTDTFTPEPFVMAAGATITCGNPTALDPGETVTVNFSLQNTGSANVGNLTATLQATGGVTSPGGPQTYGALTAGGPPVARPFTFTANGTCGSALTATLQLRDGATALGTVTFAFTIGVPKVTLAEDFDSVTAPALPPGWTSTVATGSASPWVTSTTSSETPPNNAFVINPSTVTDIRLESPSIAITSPSAQLSFSNNYILEAGAVQGTPFGFDAGVLEIALGAGSFTDIIAAGGSFVTGGYNQTISSRFGNPLGGRPGWSGSSGGYIATVVNLPAAAAGQNIKLRWRLGSDSDGSFVGWRIDSIRIADGFTCATSFSPRSGLAGDLVRISGAKLTGATGVKFSNNVNASFTVNGPALITATVPAGAATGPITISRQGCTDVQTDSFVVCSAITITPGSLPDGPVNTAYNQTLTASGGTAPYSFTLSAGTLPTGLTLSSGGVLSGAPTRGGSFNFTIRATDANGCTGTQSYRLDITCPPITLAPAALANGVGGVAYSQTLTASGVTGPFSFAVTAGTLPGGLTLTSGGVLSGTPNAAGTFNFTVTVTATASGCTGTRGYTVNIIVIAGAGSAITAENCSPANNVIDPGEAVIVNLSLRNNGTVNTTNLVATLQATGGVTSSGGQQSYGVLTGGGPAVAKAFTFTADPALTCGSTLTATLSLQDGTTNLGTATFSFTLGAQRTLLSENFDGVTAPALPAGWTSTVATGSAPPWVTSTTSSDTPPNNAFVTNPSSVSDIRLDSPSIAITAASAQLSFRNNYLTETTFDGGVLEMAIGAGAFTDIITAGGSFIAGGYTQTLSGSNPLAGRRAWSGSSGGYLTTTVNLPASAAGQNIKLRWRVTSDGSVSGTGWRIDTIKITETVCATSCGGPLCPPITITPATLPAGTLNTAYNQALTASGGATPYSFTLSAGTLPTGMTLSSAGALSGTPTQSGNFTITVKATDASVNRCMGAQSYTLTIDCQTITVNPATLPAGLAGMAYNQTLTQTGGVGAVTFSLSAGTLPAGLTLSSAGVLSGTTTQTGSFPITVKATDANGCMGTRAYTLVISNCPAITLSPTTLPDGLGGVAYNQTLTANGGAAPYSFAVTAGALPGGLTLSTGGSLSGTPNVAGAFNFTVTATDANGCTGTRSFTVNITVTLGAQTRALYVLRDGTSGNQIYGYAVNEITGALTLLPGFPISTGNNREGGGLTIDRTNQRLYAVNRDSNTVSAYAINPTTGALTPLPFSPINLGLGTWGTIAVHPSGSPLVVVDLSGHLASYQITATTATAATGSPYDTPLTSPFSIAFSQDGNYIYTGGRNNALVGFNISAATGALTELTGSPFNSGNNNYLAAFATDVAGRLFLGNGSGQVRVFTTASGIPSGVPRNPFASGLTETIGGALHPNGFYLVADGSGNRVGIYQINGSGSATTLTAVIGSPFAAGGLRTNVLALNQAGTFLFAANGDSRNLTTFSVNPTTGALSALNTQPANTLGTSGILTGMAYLAPPCPTITLSPVTLPNGTVGAAYNQTVTASPPGSYNFAVTAGALPAGLSLNATTGAITGTPMAAGTANFTITALSFGPCSGSQAYTLAINNPSPAISGLSPNSAIAGGSGFTLALTGDRFVNSTVVEWNGQMRPTTVVSATQLTASIPAGDIATAGTAAVTAFTPTPGGGRSATQSFIVNNPQPSITSLSPNLVTMAGAAFTLTVEGMSFVNGSIVRWQGSDRATIYMNNTRLTAAIPAGDIAQAGTANITVFNPAPGGGASGSLSLTIREPNKLPQLTGLAPNPVIAGGQNFPLTVNGRDFVAGSTVGWDGNNRPTTFVNSEQLTAAIPANDIAVARDVKITVFTPEPGGGRSSEMILTIANAVANVSAASFTGSVLAPDSIVAAFGVRLATAMKIATTTPLPTELEGTTLRVKDSAGAERLARLFFVAPAQINYLMPPETAAGAATVTVKSGDGIVAVGTVRIAMTAPSLFTANADGKGVAAGVALRVKADGTQVYEPISRFDEEKKMFVPLPIDLGNENEQVFLILNGSGIRNRGSLSAVTVTTGGMGQQVLFAGAVEGLAGFDQVNVGPLSRSLMGRGEVDLVLMVEGRQANNPRVGFK